MLALRWDIFCRVIDNFGDIGVCWRLSCALAARGQQVRLWVDDASALEWMAPGGCAGVELRHGSSCAPQRGVDEPGDVVIEAFGCEIDHAWIATDSIAMQPDYMPATSQKCFKNAPVWINLEYLSAEGYAARNHGLPSPVMHGPAQGMMKWFFYPGFTEGTGGLIQDFPTAPTERSTAQDLSRISLLCYEPPALPQLLQQLADSANPTELLIMAGRGQQAVKTAFLSKNDHYPAWNIHKLLSIHEQLWMPQVQYDRLLANCDLNFVRGEDSLVRALLAGRAFVWQIYPQQDGAHAAKLEAFLDWLQAPVDLRAFHRIWNGLQMGDLPPIDVKRWTDCAQSARSSLLAQRDLISQLLDFAQEKRISTVLALPKRR
jgi:uncharacterized repeat protein (TIGR03837 family)